MSTFLRDLRCALRAFKRNPGFALTAVVTLALGVGLNVTMFSVVDALLFRLPARIEKPEQLVQVSLIQAAGRRAQSTFSYPGYLRIAESSRQLDVAAQFLNQLDFGRGVDAQEILSEFVSHTYFPVLGVQAFLGRVFNVEDDNPAGSVPVTVIAYDFWQKKFGASPQVLGQTVWIGDRQFTVIGIAPQGFTGTSFTSVDAWIPISDVPPGPFGSSWLSSDSAIWIQIFGRPRNGATPQQAGAEATAGFLHKGGSRDSRIRLEPYFSSPTQKLSESSQVSLWLAGVAFIVLLIAAGNVTNLFLVRLTQRRQEMAVRLHLGATRGDLIRQTMAEVLLISVLGGAAAMLIVFWAGPLVRAFLFAPDFYAGSLLSWRLLAMLACCTLFASLLSAAAPAWSAGRPDLIQALKSGNAPESRERSSIRSALLVGQTGLTLVLMIGAGLFIRSLRNVRAINLGFEPDRLVLATMDLGRQGRKPADIDAAYERLLERVQAVPGVEHVAFSTMAPLLGGTIVPVRAEPGPAQRWSGAAFNGVTLDYFATMGMKVLRGREFESSDTSGAPLVAIVDDSFEHQLWPGKSALGRCLLIMRRTSCATIVGTVRHVKNDSLFEEPWTNRANVYMPIGQAEFLDNLLSASAVVIRTKNPPQALIRTIFAAAESVAQDARFVNVRPFSILVDNETRPWRLGASMFSLFGALALALAAVGVYGVLAFLVRERTREIGIRMAMGAQRGDILRMVVRHGIKLVGLGAVIGILSALALTQVVRKLLFGVTAVDAVSYLGACAALALVAVFACVLPAWRASRVDPAVSLRYE